MVQGCPRAANINVLLSRRIQWTLHRFDKESRA